MISEELYFFFRRNPNVTQKELARKSKVNPSTITRCKNPFHHTEALTAKKIRKGMERIESPYVFDDGFMIFLISILACFVAACLRIFTL